MTAPLSLSAIREQLAEVPQGPWRVVEDDLTLWVESENHELNPVKIGYVGNSGSRPTAAFIAAAPSTVEHLLAIIDRVEALHPRTCEINGDKGCEHGDTCPVLVCGPCGESWPCPTIKAITGERT